MPRPHEKIIEALQSDRLRIGAFVVDVTTREIESGDGAPQRLSLKAIDVLLLLARHPGKVVGRSTILEQVWPDTLPTDEVVTQAVAQLRRAFGDGKPAEYIETIAKHGYRLKAPVEWLQAEAVEDSSSSTRGGLHVQPSPERKVRSAIATLVIAGAALALAAAAWWRNSRDDPAAMAAPAAATPSYLRLTSRPGGELWPSLSPDGGLVVYSERSQGSTRLMLQSTTNVQPHPLTESIRGQRDGLPAWSPDGRQIAFIRADATGNCHFMLMPASGGDARPVARCNQANLDRFGWDPSGRGLVVGGMSLPGANGALWVVDVATGGQRQLPYPHRTDELDLSPAYSPDGRWIVFQRNVSRGDLWRVPADGGTPERLTHLQSNFYGASWTPDGQALVISRYVDHGLRLSLFDIRSRELRDLGVEDAAYPQVARQANAVVFVATSSTSAIYRMHISENAITAKQPPPPAYPSTGKDLLPSLSPDGRQLVFLSDRAGRTQLWWVDVDRPDSLRPIEGIDPMLRQAASWSQDGRRLLVVATTAQGEHLREVRLPEGRVEAPPVSGGNFIQAVYLPGQAGVVAVADPGSGIPVATRYEVQGGRWRPRERIEDVAAVRVDARNRRLLFTRNTGWGIWQADLHLRNPHMIDNLERTDAKGSSHRVIPESGYFTQGRRLVAWSGGAAVLGGGAECHLRWFHLEEPELAPLCVDPRGGRVLGATFDPVRSELYYGYETDENDDVAWMQLPANAGATRD